jgi:hypothetical protein
MQRWNVRARLTRHSLTATVTHEAKHTGGSCMFLTCQETNRISRPSQLFVKCDTAPLHVVIPITHYYPRALPIAHYYPTSAPHALALRSSGAVYSTTTFIKATGPLVQIRQFAQLRSASCSMQGLSPMANGPTSQGYTSAVLHSIRIIGRCMRSECSRATNHLIHVETPQYFWSSRFNDLFESTQLNLT